MAKDTPYRWIQVFVIQDDADELTVGDVVEVENKAGEVKLVTVKHTFPYTTKAGKELTRAVVEDV